MATLNLQKTLETAHQGRNPGMELDLDWVMGAHINKSAVERRVESLPKRRTVKKNGKPPGFCAPSRALT